MSFLNKTTLITLCSIFLSSILNAQVLFFDEADAFFQQYVKGQRIDYAAIKEEPSKLNNLINQIENYTLDGKSDAEQQAFWINAYNLMVIKSVVDVYPIPSPQVVGGFFDTKKHKIAGESMTLNDFEKQKLFEDFGDARFHFVLVCAAKGCPPILAHAYKPELLDTQLTRQTRLALNDKNFVRVNDKENTVALSQIFNWYMKDFGKNSQEIINYVNKFREKHIPVNYKVSYYTYDWALNEVVGNATSSGASNVQIFTPSVLLKEGQVEVKLFNNLYTQNAFRDENRQKVALGERQTYFTGIYQVTYGASKSGRWNIGVEAIFNALRQDTDPNSSAFRIFGGSAEGENFQTARLGYLGPRIRVTPFVNVPKFSVTSSLQIPLSNELEFVDERGINRFLAHNRVNWWTQFFYDKLFGDFQIFTEIDLLYRFKTKQTSFRQEAFFRTPVTVFLSYFPTAKSTVNINAQYSPGWGKSNGSFAYLSDFIQVGAGAKYQITPDINLEILYTNFITSSSQGAGQTFNLGLVFIR